MEKMCFTQLSTRMAAGLLLTFVIYLHNESINFYTFHYHILKSTDV